MKFAGFQPYFFPYLGHFDLIHKTDKWVVSDNFQYIKQGWINRNRILHPQSGWMYINVPLKKHHFDIQIKDVEIDQTRPWRERIFGQLAHYKRDAPYYVSTMRLVERCLEEDTSSISTLNTAILANVCSDLGINFNFVLASELDVTRQQTANISQAICNLAHHLGACEFINPPGGAHLFDPEIFNASGVKLTIQNYSNMEYATGRYTFEPALSIIDVLMWNPVQEIMRHLEHA